MRFALASRNRHGLFGWSQLALVLAALGWLLHAVLPPEPRWVVHGAFRPYGLAADGKSFRTSAVRLEHPRPDRVIAFWPCPEQGPIQIWDIATGRELANRLGDVKDLDAAMFSRDGRYLAAVVERHGGAAQKFLRCVDLVGGDERQVAIEPQALAWVPHFSAGGELLLLEEPSLAFDKADSPTARRSALLLFDTASLRLLGEVHSVVPSWRWSGDGRSLLVYAADEKGKATVRRIDRQGERTIHLPDAGTWLGVTPDHRTLITAVPSTAQRLGDFSTVLWDLAAGKRKGEISNCRALRLDDFLLADHRTLLLARELLAGDVQAVAWDLETHQPLGTAPLEDRAACTSPAGDRFALHRKAGPDQLAVYRVRPFGKLWQRDWPGAQLIFADFVKDSDVILAVTDDGTSHRLELLDAETGRARVDLHAGPGNFLDWMPCGPSIAVVERYSDSGQRQGLLQGFVEEWLAATLLPARPKRGKAPGMIHVFDTTSGKERGQVEFDANCMVDLSRDGRSLVLVDTDDDGDAAITCFDVPSGRPWRYILGIPLALGVLIFGAIGLSRRRRAPASPEVPPCA
jgi:hypothetical protein